MLVLQVIFWVLLILSVIGYLWEPSPPVVVRGRGAVVLILVGILGWVVFHGIH